MDVIEEDQREDHEKIMTRITCVTENTAQFGSPFWGEHGICFCIETDRGSVLFDTGQTAAILLHNLALLGKILERLRRDRPQSRPQ